MRGEVCEIHYLEGKAPLLCSCIILGWAVASPSMHVALLWAAVGAPVALGSGNLLGEQWTYCVLPEEQKGGSKRRKYENTHCRKRRSGITLVFVSMYHFHKYYFDYRSNASSLSLSILTQLSLFYYNQTDIGELTEFEWRLFCFVIH